MLVTLFPSALVGLILPWLVISTVVSPAQPRIAQPVAQAAKPTNKPIDKPIDPKAPAEQPLTLRARSEQLWQTHQLSFILVGIALSSYLGVLWVRPLWLLKLPSGDIALPWKGLKLPLGVVRVLKYRDRTLDAWVEQHWQTAKDEFSRLPTVTARVIHIELPVDLDGKTVGRDDENDTALLSGKHLRATFSKSSAVLLISGEGGAGKTSLAYQIGQWGLTKELARHRMLPVLIEEEPKEEITLVEAIRGKLEPFSRQREPITPEFVEQLLKSQRILVIVDHFSEMSAATRKKVTPELADFPAKALVITSRLDESLGGVPKTVLKPMRIEGSRLSQFLEVYLSRKNKRHLFEEEVYLLACLNLSRIVGTGRDITLLIAKLYADEMIQQRLGAGGIVSDSVPVLMVSYLNQLNGTIEEENRRDRLAVRKDAQRVAWACLKGTYRPTSADKEDVLSALGESDGLSAQAKLDYLEKRLGLLQTNELGDSVRIVLDPMAEYLAALQLVEDYRHQPEERWAEFLSSIDSMLERTNDSPEAIQGFLLALRDCCKLKKTEARIPEGIPERLERKAGLDPEELRRTEEKRRIRLLISELSAPEQKYRISAAEDLGNLGVVAAVAKLNLLGMVENPNQSLEARQAATQALGKLGMSDEELRISISQCFLRLLGRDDEVTVRRSIAEALGMMKVGEVELLGILESDDQPLALRQGAGRALSLIGAASGQPVPMLLVKLHEDRVKTQVKGIPVWQETLTEGLSLELVAIPGGEFVMGSPPDEVGRDWYQSNSYFSETEGLDVEMQHPVTIQAFLMSRYPITQAQWRVVAAFPAINYELDLEPSNSKGDNRPVEQVSWNQAVEFCDRLSAHTGKSYRLPSEAEWEYACRAGTTSVFYIGETLSPELANYDANYTYGDGVTGLYRQQTIEVGSFGLVNAFGLADMHGNVLEWCLDYWHSSYENAPSDGSAWITDGDERRRVLRGGSWGNNPRYCRSAYRNLNAPDNRYSYVGFRVSCSAPRT
jgi:formylglycine-generating enzyme required for sulfatase activity